MSRYTCKWNFLGSACGYISAAAIFFVMPIVAIINMATMNYLVYKSCDTNVTSIIQTSVSHSNGAGIISAVTLGIVICSILLFYHTNSIYKMCIILAALLVATVFSIHCVILSNYSMYVANTDCNYRDVSPVPIVTNVIIISIGLVNSLVWLIVTIGYLDERFCTKSPDIYSQV
jgi:hypothetical protein